ncbi:MAG: chemotaxis protein CheX [Verrucomicrobiota bacterium]
MLNLEAVANEELEDKVALPVSISGISGSVSFAGKMNGVLYLNFSDETARKCAAHILGSDSKSISEAEICDVIGELTNMVTGNLKSKMTDKGFNCTLSIPSVLKSSEITVKSTQSSIEVYNEFKIDSMNTIVKVYVFARLEEAK